MDTTYQTEAAREKLHAAESRVRETIEENPAVAVFTAFALGLGAGLAVGAVIAESVNSRGRARNPMEEFGHSVMAAAAKFLPDFK